MAADGAMPSTGWVKIGDIEDNSVSLNIPPVETVEIRVEDKNGVRWVLEGDTPPATFAGNSLDLAIDKANLLFKGEITSGATEFTAPIGGIVYLAMRLTSKSFQGKKFQWSAPAGAIAAGFTNNVTRAGMLAMSFSGSATTPVDADGEAVSPWGYKFIDDTPTT
jgi:hypothetical protein